MRRYVIFFLITVTLFGIVSAADQKTQKPVLPLDPDQYLWHFGMIPRDATVTHHFALTNNHKDTVTITEIVSDCECTHVPKAPIVIAPGSTYLMKVSFDTKTYVGETNRDIHFVTDYQPAPEMTIYFTSLAARRPNTINIDPRMTAFITGKDDQQFTIENMTDEKTDITIYLDNDSTLTVSETKFTLKGKQRREIAVHPIWDRIPVGSHYRCLVVEVSRKESFRVSIPIKINKF